MENANNSPTKAAKRSHKRINGRGFRVIGLATLDLVERAERNSGQIRKTLNVCQAVAFDCFLDVFDRTHRRILPLPGNNASSILENIHA